MRQPFVNHRKCQRKGATWGNRREQESGAASSAGFALQQRSFGGLKGHLDKERMD